MKSLYDLTNKDCGIVIYPDNTVISCVWGGEEGLPKITPIGEPIMWPAEWELISIKDIDDCQAELPETDWAYISEEDFNDLKGQPGKKYLLKYDRGFAVVLHPETWR